MPHYKRRKVEPNVETPEVSTSTRVVTTKDVHHHVLRGRRGCLKDFPNMPLDILYEIFSYLHPLDLLRLARTSKDLRALLMSKTSLPLWKAARKSVKDLPDCPSFLSEPAYADLAFDGHCYHCLKPGRNVYWEFLVRYCGQCRDALISASWSVWMPDRLYLLGDAMFCSTRDHRDRLLFHRPELEDVVSRWEAFTTDQERDDFIIERSEWVTKVTKFASECRYWVWKKQKERAVELESIKAQRLQDVVSRLRKIGWSDELDRIKVRHYFPLSRQPSVRLSKPLTDRIWAHIQPEVVECLESIKTKRLQGEYHIRLVERLLVLERVAQTFDTGLGREFQGIPHYIDWAMMPEIRALIDAPSNVVINEESFNVLKDSWPRLAAAWVEKANEGLRKLVRNECNIPPDVDVLSLAMGSCFLCRTCNTVRMYPKVFLHKCTTLHQLLPTESYEDLIADMTNISPWDLSTVRPEITLMQRVVLACGQDPTRITVNEMDQLDCRVSCGSCPADVKAIMPWRATIHHTNVHHTQRECLYNSSSVQPLVWTSVSQLFLQASKPLEGAAAVLAAQAECCWQCKHCTGRFKTYPISKESAFVHIRQRHNIPNPTDDDISLDPDIDPVDRPVYLISSEIPGTLLFGDILTAWEYGAAITVNFTNLNVQL
ncbi:hypothetical protein C8Q75DRAFT_809482 [Abortiporus biennis]|nr:hypothetical protein C8Q75DRAFT_809482 [Abortiporus biennis]